jgi:2-dehydro-3-deoxyphosphogluconate aldolase / (4S)-4-hydroxy-2-oxoglutarate aldolase
MFRKFGNLRSIHESGVVLIIRLDSADEARNVAEAAIAGGIRALEVTLSIPGAHHVIEDLAGKHRHEGIVIGAGTVLDAQSAYTCVNAGAELLVSPQLDPGMIAVGNRYQAVTISGAYTPTEIVNTATAGADIVKLFPAEVGGAAYVKTVLAPLAHIPVAPAGGVTSENAREWFDAGVACVSVGSAITKAARTSGDYDDVTAAARRFLSAVADARA